MAFDRNRHVVFANGEAWINIDALIELLAGAKNEFVQRGGTLSNTNAPAAAAGCAYVCDELRVQLIKLSVPLY